MKIMPNYNNIYSAQKAPIQKQQNFTGEFNQKSLKEFASSIVDMGKNFGIRRGLYGKSYLEDMNHPQYIARLQEIVTPGGRQPEFKIFQISSIPTEYLTGAEFKNCKYVVASIDPTEGVGLAPVKLGIRTFDNSEYLVASCKQAALNTNPNIHLPN